jgi:hypothetical protein
MQPLPHRSRVTIGVAALSFAATVLLGLAHLHFPFMGDQALFSVFGRMLDGGAVLYEDIWDVKQPGIFAFYWLGGRLFGFSEIGAHALELIYLVGFSVVLMRLLRDRYRTRWIAGLIPLVVAGWYYAAAQLDYLTQVEGLVGPLLFGTVWLVWKGGTTRFFWAGVLAGLTLFFKIALLPLVAALWLVALRESGGIRRHLARALPWLAAGLAVVAIPAIIYFAANGLLDRVWWTYVTYPPQIPGIAGRTFERLVRSVGQFGLLFLPLLLLGARGLWVGRRESLARISGAWIGVGAALFVLQLWWGYLLLVVLVPIALLALDGLDSLMTESSRTRRTAFAILAIAAIPTCVSLGSKTLDLAQNGFGLGDRLAEYQEAASNDYTQIRSDIDHLAGPEPDPIYVLGDPLYLFLTDRDQAPAITGWSPKFWTESLWQELGDGLRSEQPEMLLIDEFSSTVAQERSPETLAIVEAEYAMLRPSTRDGVWYIHRSVIDR